MRPWAYVCTELAGQMTDALDLPPSYRDDPAAQVVYDIMRSVYGSGRGAPALVSIMAVGSYGSGLLSMAGGRVRQTMHRAVRTGKKRLVGLASGESYASGTCQGGT